MCSKIKNWICILMISALLLGTMQPNALAFEGNESRSVENFFAETKLLKGDGSNYGLEKESTRMEGIIILIRLMGKEADAQKMQGLPCRFSDVPQWAAGYANYAEANQISNGVGESRFGTNERITAQQFNTMMLRTIGYNDKLGDFQWSLAVEKADQLAVLPDDMADDYVRNAKYTKRDLIETAFCYLEANQKGQKTTLIDRLISDRVISEQTAKKYGLAVDGWESITTAYYDSAFLRFDLDGEQLHITGTSEDKEQSWMLVHLKNVETGVKKLDSVNEIGSDNRYDIIMSLAALPKGDYYVDVYANKEKFNTYTSVILSSLVLRKSDEGCRFLSSPVYGQNLRIYKGNEPEEQDYQMSLATRSSKQSSKLITDLASKITEGITSDYEKVRAIHDWVAKNIYYDKASLNEKTKYTNINSEDVLKNKYTVCSGYANLTKDLISSLGIPCKEVFGFALGVSEKDSWNEVDTEKTTSNHVWNEAYVDGRWVIIDTTWDSGNSYEGGKFYYEGIRSYQYFDSTVEFFSNTHQTIMR